jgi:acetyl esterase/lipase
MIAESGIKGRTGAIGVLWNGGGATAGRTTNKAAYRQFNSIIDYVARNFNGDRHRILMSGGSRGGLTAVNMASNPYNYDYTVIFAAATATPTLLGEHATLTSTTYPPLLPSTAWSVGLSDSWRTGWTYPECAGRPYLTGLSGPEAHLFILTGTSNFDEGSAMHSPMSKRFLHGLVKAGTRVFLTVTEKDNIVPYNTQIKYAMELQELGIPFQVEVLLRGGHTERLSNPEIDTTFVRRDILKKHIMALVDDGHLPEFTSKLSYYAVNRTTGILEKIVPADNFIPFSVDIPYVTTRGMRCPIVFVGQPGTEYALTLENAKGQPVTTFNGIVPEELTSTHWLTVSADFATGEYSAVLRIKKPGQDWHWIPNTLTPSGDPAIIKVEAEEPNIGPWEAWEWC